MLTRRWALGLEYAGFPFVGWQSQAGGNTVQDALEAALAQIGGSPLRVHPLGRTDTGVHARLQIVHFDVAVERPQSAWVRGVNALLPDSVAVLWALPVSSEFHARQSARGRRYQYVLCDGPVRPALHSRRVGWFHRPLDLASMQNAAASLVGRHDFSAFRAAECQAPTPVREMRRADISRQGEYLVFDFEANAFLHHMIRNIVGSLVYVGSGRQAPAWIDELLAARDRKRAAPTFSPDGLYLIGGQYDERWGLPEQTRPLMIP
jgi:tRNA pseudouridine38-40 synthase